MLNIGTNVFFFTWVYFFSSLWLFVVRRNKVDRGRFIEKRENNKIQHDLK